MEELRIDSHGVYEFMVQPHFTGVGENFTGNYTGTFNEFTLVENVSLAKGTPIIDIFSNENILKRRDASCQVDWSKLAKGKTRKITVDEIYGAVKNCKNEFYQGCLKDFRNKDEKFAAYIYNYFMKAIGVDFTINSYFGSVDRKGHDKYSWNVYDGVFQKYAEYIAKNDADYKPTVLGAIPEGAISPTQAYQLLDSAYESMTDEMNYQLDSDLAFYVNKEVARAYVKYLRSIGDNVGEIGYYTNGIPTLQYEGIPIIVEPMWSPVLRALNPTGLQAHACILTMRGNWLFGTNKDYEGALLEDNGKQTAFKVWYDENEFTWKYLMELVAGTEIASPKNSVLAFTNL